MRVLDEISSVVCDYDTSWIYLLPVCGTAVFGCIQIADSIIIPIHCISHYFHLLLALWLLIAAESLASPFNVSVANSGEPDQTAPLGAVKSGPYTYAEISL